MRSNKIVIVILVLLAAAFVAGVGTPYLTGSKDGEQDMTEDEAVEAARGLMDQWVGSLGRSLDFLSPALDVKRLTPPAPCRSGQKTFRLTGDTPCLVRISKRDKGFWDWTDFEKAVLRAESAGLSLQVCRCETSGAAARGPGVRVTPKKLLKVSDRFKFPTHVGADIAVQGRPELEVSYFPKGKTVTAGCGGGKVQVCEVVDAASLVVLDDGGIIRLACDGCTPTTPAVVGIE